MAHVSDRRKGAFEGAPAGGAPATALERAIARAAAPEGRAIAVKSTGDRAEQARRRASTARPSRGTPPYDGGQSVAVLAAGLAGAATPFAPPAVAQPGPNDPTSQGSSANRTGGGSPSGDGGGRQVVNEDGSTASGFVYEDRERGFALNVRALASKSGPRRKTSAATPPRPCSTPT